jgi:hypothetical protein
MNSRFHLLPPSATRPSSRPWKRHGLFVGTGGGSLEVARAKQTNGTWFSFPFGCGLPHEAFCAVRFWGTKKEGRHVRRRNDEPTESGSRHR